MQKLAGQIFIASTVFYVLLLGFDLLVRGAVLNGTTLMANLFITLIFAMVYAAVMVGLAIFRGDGK